LWYGVLTMTGPTNGQVQAVYEVMRLLREDDRDRGLALNETVECSTCHRDRPAAGAVHYGEITLCNGCATDYEVLRLARLAPHLPR
jgi:hypothetical protein